jgi:4-amino-4-deoxy-L-arabinose transferase-like glycosyltransferase
MPDSGAAVLRIEGRYMLTPSGEFRVRIAAGSAATACAVACQHQSPRDHAPLWVIAGTLLAIVLAAIAFPDPIPSAGRQPDEPSRRQSVSRGLGALTPLLPALALGLPAALIWNAQPFTSTHTFPYDSSSLAAVLWMAGLILSLVTAWHVDRPVRSAVAPRDQTVDVALRSLMPAALLAVILLAALGLRLWHLGTLPFGVWIDEVDSLSNAQALSHMPFQPYAPGNYGHTPSLYAYMQAIVIHFLGTSIVAIRLSSAIFGCLGVLAAYALGKSVAGRAYGTIAAVLLALSAWSMTISRLGMSNIAAPALLGLGVWALCAAITCPAAFWFLLSGMLLGLAMMTYIGSVASIAAVIVFLALKLDLDPSYRRIGARPALLLPAGFMLAALPLLVAAHLDPAYYSARMNSVALSHEYADWAHFIPALLRNAGRHLLMFTVSGDRNGLQNLPGAPMLDPVTGTCFILGVGIAVRHLSRWIYQLLVLWLVVVLTDGILALDGETPQSLRTLAAMMPAMMLAALPLLLLWQAAIARRRFVAPRVLPALVLAVVLALAAWLNVDRYFYQQAANLAAWEVNGGARMLAGREMIALRGEGYTVLADPLLATGISGLEYPTMRYDAGGELALFDPAQPIPRHSGPLKLALILLPEHDSLRLALLHRYSQATGVALTPDFDRHAVQAWVVRFPDLPPD